MIQYARVPSNAAARRGAVLAGLCVAGLSVVVILVAISRQGGASTPVSDTAVIESYTLYASEGRLLVGPYSRYGWHHPGPLYFYLLAPFYISSGRTTAGLSAGSLAINLASVIAMVWVLARSARGPLPVTAASLCAVYAWRLSPLLASAWNPHVIVLPTMAVIVTSAAVLSGRASALPLVALFGSFAVQTHVGVLPTVVVCSSVAFARVLYGAAWSNDATDRRRMWRALTVALCLLAVSWTIPVWEQTTRSPGNLAELWRFFAAGGRGQRFRAAYIAWADMLAGLARPDFRLAEGSPFRRTRIAWAEGWAVAQIALLSVAAVLAVRSRRRFAAAFAALILLGSLVALWSATRIEGGIIDHEVFWMSALGVLASAALLDAAIASAWHRVAEQSKAIAAGCVAAVAAISGMGVHELMLAAERTAHPDSRQEAAAALGAQVERRIRTAGARPLIRIEQDAWPVAAGVLLNLQKRGVPFSVESDWLPMFTDAVAPTGGEREVLEVVGRQRAFVLTSQARAVTVASSEMFYVVALMPGDDKLPRDSKRQGRPSAP